MKTAEIYKLRTHRSPLLCAAALLAGVLAPSIVLIWYTPTDPAAYSDAFVGTFEALSVLLAIVFGGWLLGTEYRQGTVRRMLASEPRRLRALTTKGLVGAAAMSAVLAVSAGIGWTAARVVGSMHDVTVPFEGRTLLAFGVTALAAATVAYGLSAITRSDSFAMVGTVALIMVGEPLLRLVPRVGDYTIGSAVYSVEQWMSGQPVEPSSLSAGSAAITLTVWVTAFVAAGTVLFATRDV